MHFQSKYCKYQQYTLENQWGLRLVSVSGFAVFVLFGSQLTFIIWTKTTDRFFRYFLLSFKKASHTSLELYEGGWKFSFWGEPLNVHLEIL